MNNDNPIYKHDCSECKYLGIYIPTEDKFQPIMEYDLYVHAIDNGMVKLIARYRDNPPDYMSGCYFIGYSEDENTCLQIPIFREIFNRFNDKSLLKK